MTTTSIRTSLLSTLNGISGIPTVYTEGENFKPKTSTDYPFTRFTFQPGESVQDDISTGSFVLRGRARIDLYYGRNLNTPDEIIETAELVVAAYPAAIITLSGVQLTIESAWYEQIRHEPSATNIPIFVRWIAYS